MFRNQPLTAQGLATPYQFFATDAAQGACNEANAGQSAFVQGAILDPATGKISVYNPLVIDKGTKPAVVPTVPKLPANAVVALWFGFNATILQLRGDLGNGKCVNGIAGSNFGQFAYCNAPAFFQSANASIKAGKLKLPPIGMANDGKPCLTARDFGLIDMDQSDNVQTQYLATANGQTAQLTAANQAKLQNTTVIANPSDNALLTNFVDPALGCKPATAPNLADKGNPVPALALDELQAARFQRAPVALVPLGDPMTVDNNNNPNLTKTNLYRAGVDQTQAANANGANTTTYCKNFLQVGAPRLQLDMKLTQNATSPVPAAANSLFTFLAQRYNMAFGNGGLNCTGLLKVQNPVALTTDGNGVTTAATITVAGTATGGTTTGGTAGTPNGNGGVQQITQGGASFNLRSNEHSVGVDLNFTYPNHANQAVNVQVHTDSCTGNQIFDQREDVGDNGAVVASNVINNVPVVVLPVNWFFTVVDDNNKTTVGCGSVVTANPGTSGKAVLGTVLTVPQAGALPQAQGSGSFNLDTGEHSVTINYTISYPLRPNQAVNLQVRTASCTGAVFFDHRTDLGDNGSVTTDTNINAVQGTALPTNWFFAVVDPQQLVNGQPQLIGCGIVKTTGVNGNAVLGQLQ